MQLRNVFALLLFTLWCGIATAQTEKPATTRPASGTLTNKPNGDRKPTAITKESLENARKNKEHAPSRPTFSDVRLTDTQKRIDIRGYKVEFPTFSSESKSPLAAAFIYNEKNEQVGVINFFADGSRIEPLMVSEKEKREFITLSYPISMFDHIVQKYLASGSSRKTMLVYDAKAKSGYFTTDFQPIRGN